MAQVESTSRCGPLRARGATGPVFVSLLLLAGCATFRDAAGSGAGAADGDGPDFLLPPPEPTAPAAPSGDVADAAGSSSPAAPAPAPPAAKPAVPPSTPASKPTAIPVVSDAAPAPAQTAPAVQTPLDPTSGWTPSQRRWFDPSLRRIAGGPTGQTGLRSSMSAAPAPRGTVRLGLAAEWFTQSDFLEAGDRNTRLAGAFSGAFVPPGADFLELFALYRNVSNRNTRTTPELILTQGDLALGAKAGAILPAVRGSLALGGSVAIDPRVAVNDLLLEPGATSVELRALATWDVRRLRFSVPLVAHLNFGWTSPAEVKPEEGARVSCAEEFASGTSAYHRLLFSLGLEAPLPFVTPYLESRLDFPLGTELKDSAGCALRTSATGRAPGYADVLPAVIVTGLRVTALPAVTFDLGSEFGLTSENLPGLRATPAYNLFAGVSWAFEPWREPPVREVVREVEKVRVEVQTREVEKRVEVDASAKLGRVAGRVLDEASGAPVDGAVVATVGSDAPPVASEADGRYLSRDLAPGSATLAVRHDRYEPRTVGAGVRAGETTTLDVRLKRVAPPGHLRAAVVDARGRPVAGARITATGRAQATAETGANGTADAELAAGNYLLRLEADGWLGLVAEVRVGEGENVALRLAPKPRPARSSVTVVAGHVETSRKLGFAPGKATLLRDAPALLDEVIDALARQPAPSRLRVGVHIHTKVKAAAQEPLTQQRAEAVKAYLVAQGVPAALVEARGFGASQPVAPNISARGRERNERVELEFVSP